MLKVIELFAGIGAQVSALERLKKEFNFDYEIVAISEIDKYASESYKLIHGDVNNLGDITKIERLPKADFWTYSSPCITNDSLIFTKNGYKEFKDLKVGDEVLTKSNTYHKIAKIFDNGIHQTCYLKGMGFEDIHCTLNHKFYVREMYRKGHKGIRSFKEPEFKEVQNLTKKDYFGVPVIKEEVLPDWDGIDLEWSDGRKTRHKNEISKYLNTVDFWWIIGRWFADGWCNRFGGEETGLKFGIGKNKINEFKQHCTQFKVNYVEERTVYKVTISSKELALFTKPFGRGAKNKQIPNFILNLPRDLLKSFLDGYLAGDGTINSKGLIRCSSVSRKLIYGIALIVNKVYYRPVSIYKTKTKDKTIIENRIVNQKDYYTLSFKKQSSKQDKAFYENGYIWYPFKGYTLANLEHVYNMEVEEDHSYIIQGCISKNCQDISQAGKQRGFEKGSGTRSGLLWEVDRLLQVAKEHNELPKYLLMENVKALVSDKFYDGFLGWLDILKSYGYKSFWKVLNAKDYGVPQNRERVFVVSILDKDAYYEFPKSFKLEKRLKDVLEQQVDEKYYLSQKMIDGMKRSNFHTYQLDNLLLNDKDYAKTVTARFEGASQCIQVGQTNGAYERANRTYSVDGISPTITTAKSQLSNIEEPVIAASRGRNPVNPNCKTVGIPTEQRLEINEDGVANTLTTFQKDNYVVEPKMIKEGNYKPSGYACGNVYNIDGIAPTVMENHGPVTAIKEEPSLKEQVKSEPEMINPLKGKSGQSWQFEQQVYDENGITRAIKAGGGSGNIPKVVKVGNYEPNLKEQMCNKLIEEGLVKENDVIRHSYTHSRMSGKMKDIQENNMSPTIDTRCDCLGVVVKDFIKENNKNAKHQQDLLQSEDDICRTIPAGTHASTPHLLKTVVKEEPIGTYDYYKSDKFMKGKDREKLGNDTMSCVKTNGTDNGIITNQLRIRKLTPKECWRLMGFSDEQFDKVEGKISNAQLYKQAGNSIVVDVLYYIFKELFINQKDRHLYIEESSKEEQTNEEELW